MEIKARDIKTINGDVFSDSLIEEIEKIPEGETINIDLTGATPDQVMQAMVIAAFAEEHCNADVDEMMDGEEDISPIFYLANIIYHMRADNRDEAIEQLKAFLGIRGI